MHDSPLSRLLERYRKGEGTIDEVFDALRDLPFTDAGFAKVDHHRPLRCGFPEVVYCESKTAGQVRAIAREILAHGDVFVGTRASTEHAEAVGRVASDVVYNETARTIVVDRRAEKPSIGLACVSCAGTSDLPVAEEAAVCAEALGLEVTRLFDVGVAGIHRLFAGSDALQQADVVIAVAGMEGALPSVIAGLVTAPVIAVPTSVGYGASFGGIAALLAMLNSCAAGVAVMNIDNGFGAAAAAYRICAGRSATRPDEAGSKEDASR